MVSFPTAPGSAFTLIELLVVLAIMAVLMGILLPSLGGVRASGRSAACLARQRELGKAVRLYADDRRGQMPRSYHSAFANRTPPWGMALPRYLNYSGPAGDASAPGWSAWFNEHLRCPFDTQQHPNLWSYGYNVYFELASKETGGPTWQRMDQTPLPSATVLFAELRDESLADHVMAHFWRLYAATPEVEPARHGEAAGSAYLFLDGHAGTLRFSQVYDPEVGRDWFNPAR